MKVYYKLQEVEIEERRLEQQGNTAFVHVRVKGEKESIRVKLRDIVFSRNALK